ncbi:acetate kinase [Candidatus Woesearchaeota archaeon CG10_big_fil_rev_8_21_14_0_10_34_8]|nr:MAG: acetate kinase [Candidatus Woesearchaeota archaeon CG10_big_fil_rev_8_21_14_0_10_34_8]
MRKLILVLNCGSSSVKYALFHNEEEIIRGIVERIGSKVKNHKTAIKIVLDLLLKKKYLNSLKEICAVGHRVVHGGDITKSVVVNREVMSNLKKSTVLAPLHNPHNIEGIIAIQNFLPKIKNFAVFDTTFHKNIPDYAALYGLPLSLSKRYKIKRYGFHGISYKYICEELKRKCGRLPKKLIICHLGNGSSITAVFNGRSIDTSMGFTPLEGLMMGTRSGDIDAGIIFHLARHHKNIKEIDHIFNFSSGLKGVGNSNDMRDIWKKSKKDKKSKLALDMYCYRLQKYIGAYSATLNGIDALVFTAGIGENAWWVRKNVCDKLGYLGIKINQKDNKKNKWKIGPKVYVLKTNEEKMIAREVKCLI